MGFKDIVGQDRAVQRLRNLLRSDSVPPALIFLGPRGVGKAAAAMTFAKALNCSKKADDACGSCPSCRTGTECMDQDVHKVDAAYQASLLDEEPEKQRSVKVDTVRHVIRDLEMRSLLGRWKVAILERAHTLVNAAANAMLKSLEEPPPRTAWILVTHRPKELLPTIRSRCQTVSFSPLAPELIVKALEEDGVSRADAETVAPLSEGSMGRARELLEQEVPAPSEWLGDPLAPFSLADALPKKLHLSRPVVEDQLHRMAWHIRRSLGRECYSSSQVRGVLGELGELRRALRRNASPGLVIELAAFKLQELHKTGSLPL